LEKEHYIKWFEVIGDTFLYTATLKPGEKPEKEFFLGNLSGQVRKVRINCNVHGIWAAKP
jgi:superoxide reductase